MAPTRCSTPPSTPSAPATTSTRPGPGCPCSARRSPSTRHRFYGLGVDPDTEVLVTAGATEAIAGALLGMLAPGDEVIVFEPMYDSYLPLIALAGARATPVLLAPDGSGRFGFDPDALRGAVTPRTKLIMLNTPHNPTGKVFDADELTVIADVAIEHDLVVVTDEVYEHLVFQGAVHIPMATLPGMARSHAHDLVGGQDVQHHGVEGGVGLWPGAARRCHASGQAVPHLRQRRAVPTGDRRRPAPGRRILR